MRAAIYARYSSELQSGSSVEYQVRLCRRLIEGRGWAPGAVYSDRAISGATHLRPGYQTLLEDAREGRVEAVVAESLDRLSRDQEHIAGFFKLLAFRGIPLVTVAEGEIHIGLKGTMGALYLKDLAQKTRRGLEGRVRQGFSGGGLCYGYDVGRTGERTVNEAEAAVVRRIFEAFAAGRSPRAIAAGLNAEAIPGPRGTPWGASTIYGNWRRGTGILNNELYVGRLVWNRQRFVKDPETGRRQARPNPPEAWVIEAVPALRIVEDALWEAVKARQEATRKAVEPGAARPERARRPVHLFSGLLTCGACGGGYVLVGKRHYGCANTRNKGICGNRRTIRRDLLEATVLDGLREHLMHPDLVAEFVAEYQREWNRLRREALGARAGLEAERTAVERQIRNIVEAVKAGLFAPAMTEELRALEARKAELAGRLGDLPAEVPVALHPALAEVYRAKVADLAAALGAEGLREAAASALRELVREIRLVPEGEGLAIELVGELAAILALGSGAEGRPAAGAGRQTTLVAGVGFEPTTFRL